MKMMITTVLLSMCLLASAQTYQLVWSDEFNGNSLDLSKWQYEVNCDGGGNAELQCYTSNPANLQVSNGALQITAVPQSYNGKQYTSARINTKASAAWKYGRVDFSAKLPNGIYTWPALWLLPRDNVYGWWAASGEIDVMENRGNTNQIEATLHYGGGWPNNVYSGSGPQTQVPDLTADFHLYSAIWTPDQIQFLFDNTVYHTMTLQRNFWSGIGANPYTANAQPFDQYFYIIINLAIGGNFFGGNANALTVQQAQQWKSPTLSVDYVRVYQLQSGAVNNNPVPVAPVPSTTVSATPASAGCPAGTCGAASCCNDQRNGIQCYDSSIYSCPKDGYNGLYGLCYGKSAGVCKGACYNPTQYSCVNGGLVLGASPASPTPTTTVAATPASSTTRATTSSTRAATPSTTQSVNQASACPNGCGPGSCCNDARNGGLCYSPSSYSCLADTNGKYYLCSLGSGICATNCFNTSRYKCVNGVLALL